MQDSNQNLSNIINYLDIKMDLHENIHLTNRFDRIIFFKPTYYTVKIIVLNIVKCDLEINEFNVLPFEEKFLWE